MIWLKIITQTNMMRKVWQERFWSDPKSISIMPKENFLELEDAENLFSRAGYAIVKQPERIDPNENLKIMLNKE